jgi:hypothetical protein
MKIVIILIPFLIILLAFWCSQFLRLMRMNTEDFQSKEDKAIWAVSMIFLNVLGAVLFWISLKPKRVELLQLNEDIYENAKQKFPDNVREIDLALKLPSDRRHDFERWCGKKSESVLLGYYKQSPADVDPSWFGVLLAVLTAKQLETENS